MKEERGHEIISSVSSSPGMCDPRLTLHKPLPSLPLLSVSFNTPPPRPIVGEQLFTLEQTVRTNYVSDF